MKTRGSALKSILLILIGTLVVGAAAYFVLNSTDYFKTTTKISVESTPSGAVLLVDSVTVGKTPITLTDIEPGPHNFTFVLSGYRDTSITRMCIDDVEISCKLQELPQGSIKITSTPEGASVFQNGVMKGKTPLVFTVEPGVHSISIVKENFDEVLKEVNVENGSEEQINIELSPATESFYLKAIEAAPNDLTNYCDLMRYYYVMGRYDDLGKLIAKGFEAYYSGKTEREPWSRFQQEIGKVRKDNYQLFRDEVFPKMLPHLIETAKKYPKRNEILETLLLDPKNPTKGFEFLLKQMEENPELLTFRMFLAKKSTLTGKFLASIPKDKFSKIADLILADNDEKDKKALFEMYTSFGRNCLSLRKYDYAERGYLKALEVYTKEIGIKGKQTAYYHLLTCMRRQRKYNEVIKMVDELLKDKSLGKYYHKLYNLEKRRALKALGLLEDE